MTTKEASFLGSALTLENPHMDLEDMTGWLAGHTAATRFEVEPIPFAELEKWSFDPHTGDLGHASGKFFRIEGLRVRTNYGVRDGIGPAVEWEQPIIHQPEIGILGLLTRVMGGVRYFLMQVKMEPGNIHPAQLSPTVQATRSNFTQVHQGKLPLFMEYFLDRTRSRILVDQLQSEQGARFLRKRNRNMIVEVDEDFEVPDTFCWLTVAQLKRLLLRDDLVNMDARSVLSCLPFVEPRPEGVDPTGPLEALYSHRPHGVELGGFGHDVYVSMLANNHSLRSTDELISWFTELKSRCDLEVEYVPLAGVRGWRRDEREIRHESGEYFSVMAVRVDAEGREVAHWTQPLVAHPQVGLIGFLAQRIGGVLHFLAHAHSEPGVHDLIEMSPTVICSDPGRNQRQPGAVPFMEYFLEAPAERIRYDAIQSEEGGRFYQMRNRYMVVELPEGEALEVPERYNWFTLRQIIEFTRHNNYFNVEARGLVSCLALV